MELRVYGVGVVTADAETRMAGATPVATANLAFNRNFKDKEGTWKKETSYVKAQIFGPRAEKFAQFAKKGTPVCVEGYMKQDSWTDKEDQKRTVLVLNLTSFEIVQKLNGDKANDNKDVESTSPEKTAVSPPKNKQAKKSSVEPSYAQPVAVTSEVTDDEEVPF